ncbi:MAG: HAMP domain-containing sensor histidine kinase [Chitinophagales bacterium]
MNLKFKNRIALFNTLAVAFTAAIVFSIIYFVVYTTAYRHLDSDILSEKNEVLDNLDWRGDSIIINKLPEWDEAEHNKVEVNPTFLQIVDTKGRMIFHSSNLKTDQFLFNPSVQEQTFFNGIINNQKIRLGQFAIKNDSKKIIGQLTIAISQQESYSILHNLILVLLVSFPLMLLAQIILSRFAASKAIAPVHQLIATASGIKETNINTRLNLPERKDEIYQLAQTINDLLNRIESSIQQQKQFIADASHEIRTPLSAIRGTLEVLIRKQREPLVYESKIGEVIKQVDRLDLLLEQLLQLARLESGVAIARKERVQLLSIVSALIEKHATAVTQKQLTIQLNISKEAVVSADRIFLEIIIDNLFSNAIKYGNEKGTIYFNWNEANKTLSVIDNGNGISAEQIPRLFNRFYRTDTSRSSEIKGSGLGLSIVKKLADLQQLSISVLSKPTEGTTFTLQF